MARNVHNNLFTPFERIYSDGVMDVKNIDVLVQQFEEFGS